MANDQKGPPGLPEPTEPFEDEPLDENDEDLELLSDDLRRLCHPVAEANLRSLERVYARLQLSDHTRLPISPAPEISRLPIPIPSSSPKGSHAMKTLKAPNADTAPVPRRLAPLAPSRLTSVAAVLATALLLTGALWGFLYFHAQRSVSTGPTQLTATLHCHSAPFFSELNYRTEPSFEYPRPTNLWQPPLEWSPLGNIAYSSLGPTMIFDGNTCASTPSQSIIQAAEDSKTIGAWASQVVLSPDGKQVLLCCGSPAYVLDATTGRILATLQMSDQFGSDSGPGQAVWADGGTQIVMVTSGGTLHPGYAGHPATGTLSFKVQVWDSTTGALVRTALTTSDPIFTNTPTLLWTGNAWISPNGSYVAVQTSDHSLQFWDIATGQLVSTTPPIATGNNPTAAWSPDGSFFAYGISSADWPATPAQVQIWSSVTGQLVTTLTDTDTFDGFIDGLAWSPNGEYLAESSGQIHIWDTSTWQQVATFGTVVTGTPLFSQITTVAWSPDGSKLASVTTSDPTPTSKLPFPKNSTLDVWQLSSGTGPATPAATPAVTPTTP
ncbi:MAG: WD40 repeat domain-containing protein [Ktedonobacterales bacterium]